MFGFVCGLIAGATFGFLMMGLLCASKDEEPKKREAPKEMKGIIYCKYCGNRSRNNYCPFVNMYTKSDFYCGFGER